MTQLEETLALIKGPDSRAEAEARARWDSIAKPLRSLGLLEDAVVRIAALTGDAQVDISRRCVVVMCADNGVVEEGVTQTGSEVTAIVAGNMARGESCVCTMARVAHCDVLPVDIGMAADVPGVCNHKIARGTKNMARGAAMTREQARMAVETGISIVRQLSQKGIRLLATGEMGIGNTTTSSAVASVLLHCAPEDVTGRGAGLTAQGIRHKAQVIRQAAALNSPDAGDALDVLAKVGGFDLAGLCGVFLGAAVMRVPVLIDGFISAAAALAAARLCPDAVCAMIASHVSGEPAAALILRELGLEPFLHARMCLGEGTGAVAALPLLDMAVAVYDGMSTFEQINIDPYRPL